MNIYILNTLEVGINQTDLIAKSLPIKGIIGLSQRPLTESISGYIYLKNYCQKKQFDFFEIKNYNLSSSQDKRMLLNLEIDILLVLGWQRLIPSWLIEHCKIAAIGSHGSSDGISAGRGRSPLNWALLLGKTTFHTSIFKIDQGMDSGNIIDTSTVQFTQFDDIKTVYYKCNTIVANMIVKNITNNHILLNKAIKQIGEVRYLPQRLPEDGAIDWSRSSEKINNFIRALTHPYPGAFSSNETAKVIIWKAKEFHIDNIFEDFCCGEIIHKYFNGDFIVKTGDSALLVEHYNEKLIPHSNPLIQEKVILPSCCFRQQMQTIISRHYKKYPNFKLSSDILNTVNDS